MKWHNFKVHFYLQETMVSTAMKLPVPLLFDLYTNPQEITDKTIPDSLGHRSGALKMIGEFEASVKKFPLIPMGTPDPYKPPS